jgi:hypothetical protein
LIFEAVKKILEGEKKANEPKPNAIWSHNTTVSRATKFTPFRLMFGAEVVLPEEMKHKSFRMMPEVSPCPSEDEDKDLLETDRLKAVVNLQKYQEETKSWSDQKSDQEFSK